jgi:hypothetical protein
MARTKEQARRAAQRVDEALGPGLHAATIEMKAGRAYRVHVADGRRLSATLGDHVEGALVEECLRTGREVILVATPRGARIVGALQTALPTERREGGVLTVRAEELRLQAGRRFVLEVGEVGVTAEESGLVRMEGNRMVIDMSAAVRILSASLELP